MVHPAEASGMYSKPIRDENVPSGETTKNDVQLSYYSCVRGNSLGVSHLFGLNDPRYIKMSFLKNPLLFAF